MLTIIQRFGKHCSFYLMDEYVMVGRFWKPYIEQAVGGELYLLVLIGGRSPSYIFQTSWSMNHLLSYPHSR
jgi:hypothetical protein